MRSRGIRVALAATLAATALVLAGCSNDPLAEQYREGSNKGYISGDGVVTEFAESERTDPIAFEGVDESGEQVSSDDYAGQVLVLNFWYAGCAPCRAEAPLLEEANAEFAGRGASFLGVNVRDQASTAASFSKTFDITYPSVVDTDGAMQLAFAGKAAANAVPTTLILDTEGRVAARILGQVKDASILETLIESNLPDGADGADSSDSGSTDSGSTGEPTEPAEPTAPAEAD
ncbi:TlpA disulfide reductase family protein [Herbiconiux liukaitaii]|uniref:TlpA disulfide reductase family protein n=1 Tax=Herbiconiux liukaitaii TaxID=3342799 RepID=UPI0035B86B3D